MTEFSEDAQRALRFAQLHDWGWQAKLTRCPSGNIEIVANLQELYSDADGYHSSRTARPATLQALREFGEY